MTPVVPYVRQALVLGLLVLAAVSAAAQAPIGQPVNRFTPADEAQLGAEAADAVLDRLPPLNDADVSILSGRLADGWPDAIPAELRQPALRYEVGVLNIRGVTSFALPGGPVFISAKVIQLADNEDALAGLIAHELAHVVPRHATAQLSASEQYQIGAITGRQIGLTAASPMPGILEWGANFRIASYFLRFDPVYEAEADLLAARLAETAGFDPAALNDMFRELTTAGRLMVA